jgi:hypothetical protein
MLGKVWDVVIAVAGIIAAVIFSVKNPDWWAGFYMACTIMYVFQILLRWWEDWARNKNKKENSDA